MMSFMFSSSVFFNLNSAAMILSTISPDLDELLGSSSTLLLEIG
jgi:hypothetical protein